MQRQVTRSSFLGLAAVAVLAAGCATTHPPGALEEQAMLGAAQKQNVPLLDPLELSDGSKERIRQAIGGFGSERDKVNRITRYLLDSGKLDFQYSPNESYTAEQALRHRRGDCVSYANLFIAIARSLGVPSYFVRATDLPVYYAQNDTFFLASHIAVGIGGGPEMQVIDFTTSPDDWRLGLYHPIDDRTAAVLFNENLAVNQMLAGNLKDAEQTLRFLAAKAPELPELASNLGVLLMREGNTAEAERLLVDEGHRFPDYHPLFANASQAARARGHAALADRLEARAGQLEANDPLIRFARGLSAYQRDDFRGAQREFQRALELEPENLLVLAWATRANLLAGERAEGEALFSRMLKVAPRSAKLVSELENDFPALKQVKLEPGSLRGGLCTGQAC